MKTDNNWPSDYAQVVKLQEQEQKLERDIKLDASQR